MKTKSRFKLFRTLIWSVSTFALITGLVFIRDPNISPISQTSAALLVEAGGAFFFAMTVGWALDKLRDAEGYSVLWLFSQEFRKAGVLAFYSDRKDEAEKVLEQAFKEHHGGKILMAGASLRVFLASGQNYQPGISKMLTREERTPIEVKAIWCNPESNHELPVRSFVEEFNQDKTFPKESTPFNWNQPITFSFSNFENYFFKNFGVNVPSKQRVRVIQDLEATRAGVRELKGKVTGLDNSIDYRECNFAPYCTVIIFPDKAFYTPNLLCTEFPVNLPVIVFHRSSDGYKKLVNYVEFLWWSSKDVENEG